MGKIDEIIAHYQGEEGALIAVLQDIQQEYNYLPQEALIQVAEGLEIPLSQACQVATFYKAFSLEPRGKHLIHVCLGTACHVRGGIRIAEEIGRILDIEPGQTTDDQLFTLETVNCLGACALGPMMVIDGKYHGKMAVRKIAPLLKAYTMTEEGADLAIRLEQRSDA